MKSSVFFFWITTDLFDYRCPFAMRRLWTIGWLVSEQLRLLLISWLFVHLFAHLFIYCIFFHSFFILYMSSHFVIFFWFFLSITRLSRWFCSRCLALNFVPLFIRHYPTIRWDLLTAGYRRAHCGLFVTSALETDGLLSGQPRNIWKATEGQLGANGGVIGGGQHECSTVGKL